MPSLKFLNYQLPQKIIQIESNNILEFQDNLKLIDINIDKYFW